MALILIYGAPGSGKTQLTIQLKLQQKQQWKLISIDTVQEYMYDHSIQETKLFIMNNNFITKKSINRKYFNCENWKNSRDLIKNNISQFIYGHKFLVIQDDFLLISQRKFYRKQAFKLKLQYLQIFVSCNLQQCLINNKIRQEISYYNGLNKQILINSFNKLQIDNWQPTIIVKQRQIPSIEFLIKNCKFVIMNQQHEKVSIVTANDNFQKEIRQFIHHILKDINLRKQLFPNIMKLSIKQLAQLINQLKKQYEGQHSIDKFQSYLMQKINNLQ